MTWTQRNQNLYDAVKTSAAWQERPDLGMIAIRGVDRFTWLQGMVSNDIRELERGTPALQAYILNPKGYVLAEVTIISLPAPDPFLVLLLDNGSLFSVLELFDRYLIMEDVELEDLSGSFACIFVHGKEYTPQHEAGSWFPINVTGSGGWGFVAAREIIGIWCKELDRRGIPKLSEDVAEVLRIEAGTPVYPHELNSQVIAMEANNAASHISFTKGCYVGQEIIARIDSRGHTNRTLAGFTFPTNALILPNSRLLNPETGKEVGLLTSVVPFAPAFGAGMALGYLRHELCEPGTVVQDETGQPLTVVAFPRSPK